MIASPCQTNVQQEFSELPQPTRATSSIREQYEKDLWRYFPIRFLEWNRNYCCINFKDKRTALLLQLRLRAICVVTKNTSPRFLGLRCGGLPPAAELWPGVGRCSHRPRRACLKSLLHTLGAELKQEIMCWHLCTKSQFYPYKMTWNYCM